MRPLWSRRVELTRVSTMKAPSGGVHVTESGVWLLLVQKPIKRPGWWKGKFALFWMPAITGEGGCLSKGRPHRTPTDNQGARAFIDGGRGLHAETARSELTVILKLVTGGLTSVILIVLSTIHL